MSLNRLVPSLLLFLCVSPTFASTAGIRVIYGDDNRQDYFQVLDEQIRLQADSTVALMRETDLASNGPLTAIRTIPFGANRGMCVSEPFYEQETAAFCSGFLVTPDTIVTAGHCVRTQESCATTKFVFGFKLETAGGQPRSVPGANVYGCQTLVHSVASAGGEDFAVVKLDRPVEGANPLALRSQGRIQPGEGLRVVGHPSGLPMKIAGGAVVRQVLAEHMVTNLDTYGGNSGSAVFNESTGEVEGILVRGEMDYTTVGNCRLSKRCTATGCRGEDVTLIERVLPYLN